MEKNEEQEKEREILTNDNVHHQHSGEKEEHADHQLNCPMSVRQ